VNVIEVSHLTKQYGNHLAVDDVSFTVADGQICGLLGPNGAGKSTIMNILTGYLAPTEGEVKVAGFRLPEQAQQAKACVGYLPEQPPLYPEMTVQEYLDFVAELKGVKRAQRKQQVLAAARRTGLEEVLPRVIRSLSKGYRQRVGIAQALLGSPQLIILDEPTVGLDPAQVIEIRNLIRELGKAHTVILSSHILSEVQAVCQQVLILSKGHLVAVGSPEELGVTPEQIAEFLTVRSIWDYCTEELDPMHDPIDIIRSAVQVNTTISNEGLSKEYGLAIGRNLELNCRKGLMTRDLTTNAMVIASAGADARMAGAPVSVVANSGSGNQGITATMPVVATARWLDIDEEKMLRAVTLSNLIAIRIKAKFGRLSNLCGATVAATGAACGIAYLLGGGYHEVCCTIQNMVGNVTGMVCDGAKADCALKISTCVNAACQAAAMGVRGVRVQSTDGIVEHNVEYTLDNFATLSTHGTSDSVILDLMLNKHLPETE